MVFRREFLGVLDPTRTVDDEVARFEALMPPGLTRRRTNDDGHVRTTRYAWHERDFFTHVSWPPDAAQARLTHEPVAALDFRLTSGSDGKPYLIASFDLSTGVLGRRGLELEALECAAQLLPRPWPFDDELRRLRDEVARDEQQLPVGAGVVEAVRAFLGQKEVTQHRHFDSMKELVGWFHAERLHWDGYRRDEAIAWWSTHKRTAAWADVRAACGAKSSWPAVVEVLSAAPLDDDDRCDLLGFVADINWPGVAVGGAMGPRS